MSVVKLPEGIGWQRLHRDHPRKQSGSGQPEVDDWLRTKAWVKVKRVEKHADWQKP